jgi:hypothetical protein
MKMSTRFFAIVCLVLSWTCHAATDDFYSADDDTDDVDMCVGGVCADVLGQSGKITFSYDDQTITIEMDSITEVDASGDAVGTSGSTKHSFNSFASQDFEFGVIYDTTFQDLAVSAVNFSSSLVDGYSNFSVVIYLFLESGNITNYDETYQVHAGSFKFSYLFSAWPFCTVGGTGVYECTQGQTEQEGAFLDFTISMKGNDAADADNATSLVNPNVYYAEGDGGWLTMPATYPLEEVQGSSTSITYRFARFNGSLDYDPILTWGVDITDDVLSDDDDDAASAGATASSVAAAVVLATALVSALL